MGAHSRVWPALAYVEPSYGVTFGNGDKKSVALTAGIFFAIPGSFGR
jgi:hypothetical protein